MTAIPRYAVLVSEEDPAGPFAMMTGQTPQLKRMGRLICSMDGGKTWAMVDTRDESAVQHVAEMLTREAEDQAVAQLRSSIEEP